MSGQLLAGLGAASTLTGTELLYTEQGGVAKKATPAQVLAYLLSAAGSSHPGYIAGNWYYAQLDATIVAGTANGANSIQFTPIMVPRPITVAQLGIRVTTAQASNNFQLAIYAADATTKLPTGVPLASTPDMSTASAAVVTSTLSGANALLAPGLYWVAINTSGATAAFQGITSAMAHESGLIGNASASVLTSSSTMALIKRTFAQTYGTWPDMTSNATSAAAGAVQPPAMLMLAA